MTIADDRQAADRLRQQDRVYNNQGWVKKALLRVVTARDSEVDSLATTCLPEGALVVVGRADGAEGAEALGRGVQRPHTTSLGGGRRRGARMSAHGAALMPESLAMASGRRASSFGAGRALTAAQGNRPGRGGASQPPGAATLRRAVLRRRPGTRGEGGTAVAEAASMAGLDARRFEAGSYSRTSRTLRELRDKLTKHRREIERKGRSARAGPSQPDPALGLPQFVTGGRLTSRADADAVALYAPLQRSLGGGGGTGGSDFGRSLRVEHAPGSRPSWGLPATRHAPGALGTDDCALLTTCLSPSASAPSSPSRSPRRKVKRSMGESPRLVAAAEAFPALSPVPPKLERSKLVFDRPPVETLLADLPATSPVRRRMERRLSNESRTAALTDPRRRGDRRADRGARCLAEVVAWERRTSQLAKALGV